MTVYSFWDWFSPNIFGISESNISFSIVILPLLPSLSLSSSQNSKSPTVSAVGFGLTVIVFSVIHSILLVVTLTK